MMDTGDSKIDELFRKSLEEEDIQFDEAHWRDMKKKLEQEGERRREIILWTSLGGIAAMIVMSMGLWFTQSVTLKPELISKNKPELKIENADKTAVNKEILPAAAVTDKGYASKAGFSKSQYDLSFSKKSIQQEYIAPLFKSSETTIAGNSSEKTGLDTPVESAVPEPAAINNEQENVVTLQPAKPDNTSGVTDLQDRGFRPSIILSVNASPDLTAVNSFSGTKRGLGGGLLATVIISPKLGITTGLLLAKKVYQTNFSNYKPVTSYVFPVAPSIVDANCRVLDIPLNLNYTAWSRGGNKITFSAGASSYFMIEEKYNFEYSYKKPGMKYPSHYEVRNQNRHLMGVGNIAVSYEKKLNKNSGIAIQPFVKLPLTDIGFGNVKLMSAGVSANLNINLSELTGQ